MSWDSNPYSSPEKYGLRTIGDAEFSDGCYQFDTTVVWQDVATGAFYYADDAGCSCPCPFESVGRDDMTKIERLQDLLDHLDQRKRDSYRYGSDYESHAKAEIDTECNALVQAYRAARS